MAFEVSERASALIERRLIIQHREVQIQRTAEMRRKEELLRTRAAHSSEFSRLKVALASVGRHVTQSPQERLQGAIELKSHLESRKKLARCTELELARSSRLLADIAQREFDITKVQQKIQDVAVSHAERRYNLAEQENLEEVATVRYATREISADPGEIQPTLPGEQLLSSQFQGGGGETAPVVGPSFITAVAEQWSGTDEREGGRSPERDSTPRDSSERKNSPQANITIDLIHTSLDQKVSGITFELSDTGEIEVEIQKRYPVSEGNLRRQRQEIKSALRESEIVVGKVDVNSVPPAKTS